MTTTVIGILLVVLALALKYGGSFASGMAWLWSKVPALPKFKRTPTTPAATVDSVPTAAEAFAALTLIQAFKAKSSADPGYKLVIAALKETQA